MLRKILGTALTSALVAACGSSGTPPPVTGPLVVQAAPIDLTDGGRPLAAPPAAGPARSEPAAKSDGVALAHEDARAVDHLARARSLEQAGDVAGALAECRRAAFDAGSDATALEGVARLARRLNDRALEASALNASARAFPGDARPMIRLARLHVGEGASQLGLDCASEAVLRDPGAAEAWHLRGRAQLQLDRLSDAIRDFKRASTIDPGHAWAHNNLGYAFLHAGEAEKAVAPLERAAALLPGVAFVQNNLGIALERSGRKDEAKKAYARALELNPRYVKAQLNRSRLMRLASAGHALSDALPSIEPDLETELHVPAEPLVPPPSPRIETSAPLDLRPSIEAATRLRDLLRPLLVLEGLGSPGEEAVGADFRDEPADEDDLDEDPEARGDGLEEETGL